METPYSQLSHVLGAQSVPLQTNTSTTVAELRRLGDAFIHKLEEICLLDGGMERDVSIYLDQLEASMLQFFDELDKLSPSNQRECITLLRRRVYGMPENITRGGDARNVRMHAAFEEVANYLSRFHEVRLIPETSESNQLYKKEKITKLLDDFRWRVLNCRSSILNSRKNNKVGWYLCVNYLMRPFALVAAGIQNIPSMTLDMVVFGVDIMSPLFSKIGMALDVFARMVGEALTVFVKAVQCLLSPVVTGIRNLSFFINRNVRPFMPNIRFSQPIAIIGFSISILLWIYHAKYGLNEAPSVDNSITQDSYQSQRNGTSEVQPPTLHD